MAAIRDGKKPAEALPLDYMYYVWRRKMGISPEIADRTPATRMFTDLNYMELEAEYLSPKEELPKKNRLRK